MLAENKAGERDEESRTAAETSRFGKGSRENNWKYWCVNLFPKPLSPQFQIAMHYTVDASVLLPRSIVVLDGGSSRASHSERREWVSQGTINAESV